MIFNRRTEVGIVFHSTIHKANTFIFKLFTVANLASVGTATMRIIGRRRGRGSTSVQYRKVRTIFLTYRSFSGGMKSFSLSLRLISSKRKWIA